MAEAEPDSLLRRMRLSVSRGVWSVMIRLSEVTYGIGDSADVLYSDDDFEHDDIADVPVPSTRVAELTLLHVRSASPKALAAIGDHLRDLVDTDGQAAVPVTAWVRDNLIALNRKAGAAAMLADVLEYISAVPGVPDDIRALSDGLQVELSEMFAQRLPSPDKAYRVRGR